MLLPAVSVVPDRLNPLPAADNDGVALSVSVPPEPPTPFHVHARVRAASAVMTDVPPVFATVSGLADTVTLQSLQDAYCFCTGILCYGQAVIRCYAVVTAFYGNISGICRSIVDSQDLIPGQAESPSRFH